VLTFEQFSQSARSDPNDFYILASKDRVRIPHTFAAEMVPYDPSTRLREPQSFAQSKIFGTSGLLRATIWSLGQRMLECVPFQHHTRTFELGYDYGAGSY
jgi:2'-deoxycytidine 5'-triphosphate deaminase (DCD), C-terminal domain